jgi:1-acyl-sn-glycerol-3-phosphate acyltransferase
MPPDGSERPTPALLRAYRLVRLLLHVLYGCAVEAVVFPLVGGERQLRIIQRWSRQILAILGVRLHVVGHPPSGHRPTLLVCNHVSWLDVWVVHAVSPVRFVAKSDVTRWPVIGWLVKRAGTIFIERARRHDTARTNRAIVETLTKGERVGIFPEGTTTDGTHLRPFHASLFQPVLGAGARVVPVAIHYPLRDGAANLDAAYAGERSLLQSVGLILRQRNLRAEVTFAAAIEISGKTRRQIAREAEEAIARSLRLAVPDKRPGAASGPPGATPTGTAPRRSRYPARTDSAG